MRDRYKGTPLPGGIHRPRPPAGKRIKAASQALRRAFYEGTLASAAALMHDEMVTRSYYIRARTVDGKTLTVGPYEKHFCEQVLGDIRNRISIDDHAFIPSHQPPVHYDEIDLRTIGMEADDAATS